MEKETINLLKDLFWCALFLIFVYSVSQNPIVQPHPKVNLGTWTIEKMQRPLFFGLTGHNFLVIRNSEGKLIGELHGLATNMETKTWKYLGTEDTDMLKVWEFTESRYDRKTESFPGVVLAAGNEDLIMNLWNKARECAQRINQKDIYYTPYGINLTEETENSNSVSYTIAKCIGIEKRHLGLITPGARTDLLSK